jgi:hypothetical protein
MPGSLGQVTRWISKAVFEKGGSCVDGRDKVSQKWSYKIEPPGNRPVFNVNRINLNLRVKQENALKKRRPF